VEDCNIQINDTCRLAHREIIHELPNASATIDYRFWWQQQNRTTGPKKKGSEITG